jgi:hypothetical protein
MPRSPVWDAEGGFGGDGQPDSPVTVGEGRCVRDGPFANLEAQYFGDQPMSHCLSRGFASGDHLSRIAEPISPDALEELRETSTRFAEYAPELERRAHTFMRDGVRGDFRAYTGPYGRMTLACYHLCIALMPSQIPYSSPITSTSIACGLFGRHRPWVGALLMKGPDMQVMTLQLLHLTTSLTLAAYCLLFPFLRSWILQPVCSAISTRFWSYGDLEQDGGDLRSYKHVSIAAVSHHLCCNI